MKGKFITLEGIEGVGKTTNVKYVQGLISGAGHPVIVTREPGGRYRREELTTVAFVPLVGKEAW